MHEEHERWVTVSQAARHYRVSRNTVYEACRENELVFMRVRSLLRVRVDAQEEYLTVAETAKLLDISTSTVYEACARGCNQGAIPHLRIRSRIRIPRSQLAGAKESEPVDELGISYNGGRVNAAMGLMQFQAGRIIDAGNCLACN